jgi:hypothetical protein
MNNPFFLSYYGPPLVVPATPPVFGTPGTTITGGTGGVDVSSYSGSYTRPSGAGLVALLIYKSNNATSPTVSSITYNAVAMSIRCQDVTNGANDIGIAIATMDPGVGSDGGSYTLTATLSGTSARQGLIIPVPVTNTAGCAGPGQADSFAGSASTHSVNITPTNSLSGLIGIGGCRDSTGTLTQGSGWTSLGTGQTASSSNDVEAIIQSLFTGATSPQACDFSASITFAEAGAAVVEWLPL